MNGFWRNSMFFAVEGSNFEWLGYKWGDLIMISLRETIISIFSEDSIELASILDLAQPCSSIRSNVIRNNSCKCQGKMAFFTEFSDSKLKYFIVTIQFNAEHSQEGFHFPINVL